MNKKSIVYNHIKKINEARKIGKKAVIPVYLICQTENYLLL